MATSGQIQVYGYSDTSAQWVSTNKLSINRTAYGGAVTSVRHTTPATFAAMLTAWQALLDVAVPACAPWALTYSATTKRVTIASAGALFDLALLAQVGKWLGFAVLTSAGANSYTGQRAPAGAVECLGLDVAIPVHAGQTDLQVYRHGRAIASTWGTTDVFALRCYVRAADYETQLGYGWLRAGRVRVVPSGGTSAIAYSSAQLDGYIDGWVQSCKWSQVGQASEILLLEMTLTRSAAALVTAEVSGFWGAVRYGWSPVYALTVSGVPVYWTERATGLTLGTYTENASLVIDDSADVGSEIDRNRGIGVGLSLGWKILDTAAARTWLARPGYVGYLQADLTAAGGTVTVDSTTGSPAAPNAVYIGTERITYNAKGATTFTVAARGTAGSLAAIHKKKGSAVLVTDTIRTWKGRDVILYAIACDPSGYVTGTAILDDAVEVWRGRATASPLRQADGWQFGADALDRLLERSLAGPLTGQIVGQDSMAPVQTEFEVHLRITAKDATGVTIGAFPYNIILFPFGTGYTNGDLVSVGKIRQAISDAWAAEIASQGIGAILSATLDWSTLVSADQISPRFTVATDATICQILIGITSWGGSEVYKYDLGHLVWQDPAGMTAPVVVDAWWAIKKANPQLYAGDPGAGAVPSICVQLDDGATADCPTSGMVRITSGDQSKLHFFTGSHTTDGVLYLSGLSLAQGGADWPQPWAKTLAGATAEIWESATLDLSQLALRMLESSGTLNARGVYDKFSQGAGYGLDEDVIHDVSFTAKAQTIPLTATLCPAGHSFVDLFGGALSLARLACVVRADRTLTDLRQRLHLVETSGGGSDYSTQILDETMLCMDGQPVEATERLEPPTVVKVQRLKGPGDKDEDKPITVNDIQQIESRGQVEASFGVPCDNRTELRDWVIERTAAMFASDQDGQAIKVRVPPWVVADPGDLVWLSTRHPSVYDPATAAVGFTGAVRVVGRVMCLKTQAVTLTLLLEGLWPQRSLCPAGEVASWTGGAGAPTSISITDPTGGYHAHFSTAITLAGGAVHVYHYQPGQVEGTGERYSLSASTLAAGVCTLTVAAQVGVFNLSTALRSHLTLPALGFASITTYQAFFAHESDGSFWI